MASPNANLTEIVTTTLRNRNKEIADNVTNHNWLLRRLDKRGNKILLDGGRTIVEPLEYAQNSTGGWYSGYETLNISPSDVISAAEYDWKQAYVNVTMSGLEKIQNSGSEALYNLLDRRIQNALKTMRNIVSSALYSDGSAVKQIGGLQLLVADLPTSGTIGGINRATYSFWQNQYYRGVTDGGAAVSAANIQQYMMKLWINTVRGEDKPDLIVADTNYFNFYYNSLTAIQRVTDKDGASALNASLKFMDADVGFDTGGGCPANHMYFLNTEYMYFKVSRMRNFVPDDEKVSISQDAMVVPLYFAGNMTVSNSARQGVLVA